MKPRPQKLTAEAFARFGTVADLLHPEENPQAVVFGEPPIEFFPDLVQVDLGKAAKASISVCRVSRRPLVIDVTEEHDCCAEGVMALNGAVLMHVGPASPKGKPRLNQIEVFRLEPGVQVVLKPGTLHHAVFTAANDEPVCVQIILAERIYATDCHVYDLREARWGGTIGIVQ